MGAKKQVTPMLFYGAIALIVLSTTLYHLFQKLTPGSVHPLLGLAVTYASATILCVALLLVFPLGTSLGEALRQLNWASIALALAVTGIEVGFLLAYRAGWNISMAALVANTAVAMLLAPLGLLLFAERLSPVQLIGMGLCVVGLLLINQR